MFRPTVEYVQVITIINSGHNVVFNCLWVQSLSDIALGLVEWFVFIFDGRIIFANGQVQKQICAGGTSLFALGHWQGADKKLHYTNRFLTKMVSAPLPNLSADRELNFMDAL